MVISNYVKEKPDIRLFKDMDELRLEDLLGTAGELTYNPGDICQQEGEKAQRIEIIQKGKVGVEVDLFGNGNSSRFILDTFGPGEAFGLSALIKYPSWSTLRVMEPTTVWCFDAEELMALCKNNEHVGYIVMKNMAALVASRLRRSRMVTLRAISGIKVFSL